MSVKNSNFIRKYSYMPGAPEGHSHNIIKGFCEDKTGKIWVATDGGGLNFSIAKQEIQML
jgi:hypothetical protein